ncbi:MAG: sulfite exporter TauE/SafE family protein [Nitrospirae bacterium]|nr:sulfite exporter TauE/SafE family protein [Nitrospirota bacterium]
MFTSGLLGGFGHCLGMCGPLVASYSVAFKGTGLASHVLYNLGRISTYTLLGGLAAMTASFIGIAGHIQRLVMTTAGIVIVLMGMGLAGWLPAIPFLRNQEILASNFIKKFKNIPSEGLTPGSFYLLGIFSGFMPCGLIYTALITAARAGMEAGNHFLGFLNGITIMLLFGLGTMPALLLLGKVMNAIGAQMRLRLYRLSAILMIIMGIIFIVRSL